MDITEIKQAAKEFYDKTCINIIEEQENVITAFTELLNDYYYRDNIYENSLYIVIERTATLGYNINIQYDNSINGIIKQNYVGRIDNAGAYTTIELFKFVAHLLKPRETINSKGTKV